MLIEKESAIPLKNNSSIKTYNFLIDNEGSMYYIKQVGESDYYIVSHDINKDYEKWEEKIDISNLKPKQEVKRITLSINSENDLIVTGFLTEKGFGWNHLRGYFFMKIDSYSKEIVATKVIKFSNELKNSFLTAKEKEKGKEPEIWDRYDKINTLNRKDGGIIFIAELSYHEFRSGNYNYFNDLIILNLSTNGDLIWDKRIMKMQEYKPNNLSTMDMLMSGIQYFSYFAFLNNNNNLKILYNDHPDNIGKNTSDNYKYFKKVEKSVLAERLINLNNGNVAWNIIKDLNKDKLYLKPQQCYKNNNIILFAQYKKNYKFGILSFK